MQHRFVIKHPANRNNEYASFLEIFLSVEPSKKTINCLQQNLGLNGWWGDCGTFEEWGIAFRSNSLIDELKLNIALQCLHLSGYAEHPEAFINRGFTIEHINDLFDSWKVI